MLHAQELLIETSWLLSTVYTHDYKLASIVAHGSPIRKHHLFMLVLKQTSTLEQRAASVDFLSKILYREVS
jgi:hypothetical protein